MERAEIGRAGHVFRGIQAKINANGNKSARMRQSNEPPSIYAPDLHRLCAAPPGAMTNSTQLSGSLASLAGLKDLL
jgi:hypothetical protein